MIRSKVLAGTAVLCGVLFTNSPGWSQQADGLQALQRFIANSGAEWVVKISGLHITTNLMGRPSEMRIQNGVVSRGSSRWVHGDRDVPIPVGQIVRLQRVEAAQDAKSDLLRVYVVALGSIVPVSFVIPKGTLGSMNEPQMQALVETVFGPATVARPQQQAVGGAPHVGVPSGNAAAPSAVAQPNPASTNRDPERTPIPSESVLDLDGLLKKHAGDAIVKIEGVHAVMQSPDFVRDNIIVDGVFQPRARGMYRGMRDVVLWPNSHVTFQQLAAFTDNEHDILHLVVRSDLGAFAPFAFLLPKGELSSMSKRQIMATVDPFIVFAAADENTFRNEPDGGSKTAAKPAVGSSSASGQQGALVMSSMPPPSRAPDEGCMWVPYVSKKWSLELLREHCTGGRNDWTLSDVADGIGMSTQGPAQGTAIQIFSKTATEPIETAIQHQVIAKIQDPAARVNCRVTRQSQEEEPGWHEYGVVAMGAYAHPKVPPELQMEKEDVGLCGGLYGGDTSSVFLYNPQVSKTQFFGLYGLSDPLKGQPFDIFSLRFEAGSGGHSTRVR